MKSLTNDKENQRKVGELLKIGIRIFPDPIMSKASSIAKVFVMAYEKKVNGYWRSKKQFKKLISDKEIEEAYVKTVNYLYEKVKIK
ncbi:hypothetical protein [Kordia sp.]|uniref:hypothetical protein n=1 Tax=Kordia sp. TaxID=1965332 RepID=UPI0025B7FC53|nr:hypothetical protein [Kordia sp.]MCH2194404.1 hypothetical protein [Kordia sp.]